MNFVQTIRLLYLLLLSCFSGVLPAWAKDSSPEYPSAVAELAPELRYLNFVWAVATGDLNGDGVPDVALLMTGSKGDDSPREERLVVLAGRPDGGFRILSISGDFCHPSKFYNLDIRKRSLFVEVVEYADAARLSSYTLQFRHDAKLNDLALIGKEVLAESYEDGALDRISSNYLSGDSIHTIRKDGRTKSVKARVANKARPGLQGSTCDAFLD